MATYLVMNISVGNVLDFIEKTERTHFVTSWYGYEGKVRSIDHSIRAMLNLGPETILPREPLLSGALLNEFRLLREFVTLKSISERTAVA